MNFNHSFWTQVGGALSRSMSDSGLPSKCHQIARSGPYALRPDFHKSSKRCKKLPFKQKHCWSTQVDADLETTNVRRFLSPIPLHSCHQRCDDAAVCQNAPLACQHLCPAKLQTSCNVCCFCQSLCLSTPSDYCRGYLGNHKDG